MQHVLGLDHVIILVRDLDDADARMARLGFRPTPRGHHSAHMGTANSTVMLSMQYGSRQRIFGYGACQG